MLGVVQALDVLVDRGRQMMRYWTVRAVTRPGSEVIRTACVRDVSFFPGTPKVRRVAFVTAVDAHTHRSRAAVCDGRGRRSRRWNLIMVEVVRCDASPYECGRFLIFGR